jgi:hypothetical protein
MDLITSCGVELAPSRVVAVAECDPKTYRGDTELLVFLRCLGDAPDCDRLGRCSGPIESAAVAPAEKPAGQ